MPERIALKKLTASDLTFFEWHFRNRNAGNQKSINLNADVFVDRLYPTTPGIGDSPVATPIPVALTLYGPGKKGAYNLARKIVKGGSYKNWRLNGEFVYNPDGDPDRFNVLQPDDLALLIFKGDTLPSAVDAVLISASVAEDASLHTELSRLVAVGRRSMIRLGRADLQAAAATASVPPGHPVEQFLSDPEFESAIEDAAHGSDAGSRAVRRRTGRKVTGADLQKARENAERIGRDGEGLVSLFLDRKVKDGEMSSSEWTSDTNAVSPYDFEATDSAGKTIKIEVKSTEGDFGRTVHISAAEIAEAAESKERYDLYRVFGINADGAKLKIAENINTYARSVADSLAALPKGIRPDGFSLDPAALDWGDEIEIERPEEPE